MLGETGLTVSDGIRLFLRSVATKKKLPFHPMDFFEPDAETIAAMEEAERGENLTTCETVVLSWRRNSLREWEAAVAS